MLKYGCTRLEIGVQSVYEDVARDTNRYAEIELNARFNILRFIWSFKNIYITSNHGYYYDYIILV